MRKLFVIVPAIALVLAQGFASATTPATNLNTQSQTGSYSETGIIIGGAYVQDAVPPTSGPGVTVNATIQERVQATAQGFQMTWNLGNIYTASKDDKTQIFTADINYNGGQQIAYGWDFAPKTVTIATDNTGYAGVVYKDAMVGDSGKFDVKFGGCWGASFVDLNAVAPWSATNTGTYWLVPTVGDNHLNIKVELQPKHDQAPGAYHFDPILCVLPVL